MATSFSNPEIPLTDLPQYQSVQFHPISKKLLTKALVQQSILLLVVAGALGFVFYFEGIQLWGMVIICGFALLFLIAYLNIFLRQKKYGYALRERDILYKRGYITHKLTVIPFNRVQHSAIAQSLLDKLLGIASLKIYTAGGSGSDITIPGLLPKEARKLNEALTQKVATYEH